MSSGVISRAPIDYVQIRAPLQTVRLFGAAVILGLVVAGLVEGLPSTRYLVVLVPLLCVDAALRRTRGTNAVWFLLIDAVAIAAAIVLRGPAPYTAIAALLYVLTGSLLLLPPVRAAAAVVLTAGIAASTALAAPLVALDAGPEHAEPAGALDVGAALTFVGIIGFILYGAAVTLNRAHQENIEALATERRANELKNEFVSMVSHELRTPLTSIAGFSEMLLEEWQALPAADIAEFLTIMKREAEHLNNMVEDVLVIPRLEAGRLPIEPAEFELGPEVRHVARILGSDAAELIDVAVPRGVMVFADPLRVRQIIRNLLDNAIKYGGDQILVEGHTAGDFYQVSVSDNGVGIREEDQDRVFEQFEQISKGDARSTTGIGLGLPIARQLARAMGGDLWYENRFPTGARFVFTLRFRRIDPARPAGDVEPAVRLAGE